MSKVEDARDAWFDDDVRHALVKLEKGDTVYLCVGLDPGWYKGESTYEDAPAKVFLEKWIQPSFDEKVRLGMNLSVWCMEKYNDFHAGKVDLDGEKYAMSVKVSLPYTKKANELRYMLCLLMLEMWEDLKNVAVDSDDDDDGLWDLLAGTRIT